MIPVQSDRYQANALHYFRAYFILSVLGYLAFSLRSVLPLPVSVGLSNGLLLAASYTVIFGIWWRRRQRRHLYKHPAMVHILALMLLQGVFAEFYPDEFVLRLVVIYINNAAVLLYALSLFYRSSGEEVNNERMLSLGLAIAVLFMLCLPVVYFASNDIQMFLNITLLMQNTLVLMLFSSFFYLILTDSLARLKLSASLDAVTGLYNRRYFFEQASKFIDAAGRHQFPISVIVCEIDNFSKVNDDFGYFAGDNVMQAIARIIKQQTRNEDLIGRYDGKEFVVLLPQTRINGAMPIAERMREQIQHTTFEFEGVSIAITASFGVTSIAEHSSISETLNNADEALREAKLAGQNCVRQYTQKAQEKAGD